MEYICLHFAAREGQIDVCNYLLEELKLYVDSIDDDGETTLIHAACQGHIATAKYLIDCGANPTIASNLGAMTLHHSAGIALLVENGKFLLSAKRTRRTTYTEYVISMDADNISRSKIHDSDWY